ncbi:MAG: hypothetical protein KAQ63_02910 [Candidatus Moranbacteria bacterium]|nr:hypothetical protein [Candidatus Moranbacteria bacterium]
MKKEKIIEDNAYFFILVVGMTLGIDMFSQSILESYGDEDSVLFPTDIVNRTRLGYVKVDLSVVRNSWPDFTERIKGGLFERASYEFSSNTRFKGDLYEKVNFEKDGYQFSFEIEEYERNQEHQFKRISPEKLPDIPEEEKLGRLVCLTITPIEI